MISMAQLRKSKLTVIKETDNWLLLECQLSTVNWQEGYSNNHFYVKRTLLSNNMPLELKRKIWGIHRQTKINQMKLNMFVISSLISFRGKFRKEESKPITIQITLQLLNNVPAECCLTANTVSTADRWHIPSITAPSSSLAPIAV